VEFIASILNLKGNLIGPPMEPSVCPTYVEGQSR